MATPPKIYIFSRGRVGDQKTLQYLLPSKALMEITHLITPSEEVEAHRKQAYGKDLNIIGVSHKLSLERKRAMLVRKSIEMGDEYICMYDDDIKLGVLNREENKHLTAKKRMDLLEGYLLEEIPTLLRKKKLSGLTYPIPLFANQYVAKNGEFKEGGLCACTFYWNVEHAAKMLEKYPTENLWFLDNAMSLAFLCDRKKTGVSYLVTRATDFSNVGGAVAYRSKIDVQISFLRLMEMFPGLVSRGKDTNHANGFLKVNWAKALEISKQGVDAKAMNALGKKLFDAELERAELLRSEYEDLREQQRVEFISRKPVSKLVKP